MLIRHRLSAASQHGCYSLPDTLTEPRTSLSCLRKRVSATNVQVEQVAVNIDTDVLIIDTLGELSAFLNADAAFIGGSLVPRGGHNPVEAATGVVQSSQAHVAVNFATIVRDMERGGAIRLLLIRRACGPVGECLGRRQTGWRRKAGANLRETRRGATRRQLDL